jgi:hypothetical protein
MPTATTAESRRPMAKSISRKAADQYARRRLWAKVGDQGKMDSDLLAARPIRPLSHLSSEHHSFEAPGHSIAPRPARAQLQDLSPDCPEELHDRLVILVPVMAFIGTPVGAVTLQWLGVAGVRMGRVSWPESPARGE